MDILESTENTYWQLSKLNWADEIWGGIKKDIIRHRL